MEQATTIYSLEDSLDSLEGPRRDAAPCGAFAHICPLSGIHPSFTSNHSFICLFIYLFIHLLNWLLICSFICSIVHSFIHSFIHLFIHSFIQSFIHSFIHSSPSCVLPYFIITMTSAYVVFSHRFNLTTENSYMSTENSLRGYRK